MYLCHYRTVPCIDHTEPFRTVLYRSTTSRSKILVFLDPTLGKYYATTYKRKVSGQPQPLAKILVREILLCEPGVPCRPETVRAGDIRPGMPRHTANLRTKMMDFRGFY